MYKKIQLFNYLNQIIKINSMNINNKTYLIVITICIVILR